MTDIGKVSDWMEYGYDNKSILHWHRPTQISNRIIYLQKTLESILKTYII